MAVDTIDLPDDDEALAFIINQHGQREEARLAWYRAKWLLAYYYLNGARIFRVFNIQGAEVAAHFLDDHGNLEFQSQKLLSEIDRVSGQLAALDLRPKVMRTGLSLEGIREKAVAQIISDAVVGEDQLDEIKTKFCHIFTTLGSCAIQGHLVDHPTVGLTGDLELIHPREIFPFPSLGADYTKQRGILRQRYVPMSFLEERFGAKKVKANKDKLDWWTLQIGERVEHSNNSYPFLGSYTYSTPTQGMPDQRADMAVVRIRELWVTGPRNTVQRYAAASGKYVFVNEDYEGKEVYCPISHGRFMETGHFHGSGMFDLLFSQCRQLELLQKRLYNNVRDADQYGILVLPEGQYPINNQSSALREVGVGLKVMSWMPDPVTEAFKPFAIQPFNTGDFPGKVAAFARQQIDDVSPYKDLIEEKGRVDSATGLQFLDEQVSQAMTTPSRAVNRIFGDVYRSLVASAVSKMSTSPRPIPVSKLTLDLAGAVINPEDNTVTFKENPLPDISRLSFQIRETTPKSESARVQGALQLLEMGISNPDKFMLFCLKEGLDIPVWTDDYTSAYESVCRNILILYGDGLTSGQIVVTPHTSKPEIQIIVLEAFMSSPHMGVASPTVVDNFKKYREFLIDAMGLTLPQAVPNPDDAAIMSQTEQMAMSSMAQQMQGGGPQPPAALQNLMKKRAGGQPQGSSQ